MKKLWSNRLKNRKEKYTVYSIQNLVTKQIYFGYTEAYRRRMNEHRNIASKPMKKLPKKNLLYRDMKALGLENFEFKAVQEFDTMQEAVDFEKKQLNSYPESQLYNKQKYSDGVWKSGSRKPRTDIDEAQYLINKIIETQLQINLKLLEQ